MEQVRELRAALVRKLRRDGALRRAPVERAFLRVPRHIFVPEVDVDFAYRDIAVMTKIVAGEPASSSSQPTIMAIMLEQLSPDRGDNVLEIGAGTGYNAALLDELVGPRGQVTTVDIDADIVQRARSGLDQAGYTRVHVEHADGFEGWVGRAPYDRIIATVGLGDIPRAWREQLKPGGRLVVPLLIRGVMRAVAFRKGVLGNLYSTSIQPAAFMAFRGSNPLVRREVRVGPELGLFAWFAQPQGADPPGIYESLQQTWTQLPTGVRLTRANQGNLGLWIRAHEASAFTLRAEGALVNDGLVPGLGPDPQVPPWTRTTTTIGLWGAGEVALLAPDENRSNSHASPDETPELVVRRYGKSRAVAKRLVDCVRAWERAGSPSDDQLSIRVVDDGRKSIRRSNVAQVALKSCMLEISWRKRTSPGQHRDRESP